MMIPKVIGHWDVYELLHRVNNSEEQPFESSILPVLKDGGVQGVFFAVGGDSRSHASGSDHFLRGTLETLDVALEALQEPSRSVSILRTRQDVEALHSEQIGFLLVLEGGRPLEGSLAALRQFYRLGIRSLLLTWNGRNELGDGVGEGPNAGGLSQFGRAVVKEMRRLGMLLDLSHLSERGFWDALTLYEGVVVASHSNAKALHAHPRNLTDDQIRAVADTGGVIGIAFMPAFLGPGTPSIATIVDHIAYIADLVGAEHVGIGPDFSYAPVAAEHRRHRKYEGVQVNLDVPYPIATAAELPLLEEELITRGFREQESRAILGGNFLRVLREVLPAEDNMTYHFPSSRSGGGG